MLDFWVKTYYFDDCFSIMTWCAWLPDGADWTISVVMERFQNEDIIIDSNHDGIPFLTADDAKFYCDDEYGKSAVGATAWILIQRELEI